MAIYTPLSEASADAITRAHGLGACRRVIGIPAGSVNSNFVVEAELGEAFVRVYEDQDEEGVAYEWALLEHLARAGVPLPRRLEGPGPGELRVEGKPTAVFERVGGFEVCQRMVDADRASAIGAALAGVHRAGASFSERRPGRFEHSDMRALLHRIERAARPELEEIAAKLSATFDDLEEAFANASVPRGVIHGDLFRDNVRFDDSGVLALLDWESASDGRLVFDLAVTLLAWCCGDTLDFGLCGAMVAGYERVRRLSVEERAFLKPALRSAAARFTVTRITDFHLREAGAAQIKKDWRRFAMRLEAVDGYDGFARLGLADAP